MNVNELQDLFGRFNAQYFESRLQICPIEFTDNLKKCSMGHWDSDCNRIQIRKGLCDLQQQITLLHEMIHMRISGHEADFQAELDRCANNSTPDLRKEILCELQRVKDFSRFGTIGRNAWIELELERLGTERLGQPWEKIKPCILEASLLTATEFAEIEDSILAHWDWLNHPQGDCPPWPTVDKQKCNI
jgi:hypothetical protein